MHLLGAWVSSDSENRGLSTESSTVLSTLQVLLMGDVSLPTPSLNTSWAVQGRRVRDTAQTKGTKEQESSGNTWMLQKGIMAKHRSSSPAHSHSM